MSNKNKKVKVRNLSVKFKKLLGKLNVTNGDKLIENLIIKKFTFENKKER